MSTSGLTFTDAELSTAKGLAPSISGPNEAARFAQYCVDYYGRWYEASKIRITAGAIPHDQAALLLFSQVPDVSSGLPGVGVETLRRTHAVMLSMEAGVFVCSETLASSFRAPVDLSGGDEIMDFAIKSLRDDQTFVIMLMAKQLLLVHHAGAPLTEWYSDPMKVVFSGGVNEVTLATVDEELKKYHQEHTSTPLAYTARLMWHQVDKERPKLHHKPELHVQTTLLTHLKAWFRQANVLVQEEISNAGGRVDIQISRASAGNTVKSTLELKILKPDESDNWNLNWGKKGIEQAKDYINHETDFSMACLFDARLEKKDHLAALDPFANEAGVKLRRFEMKPPEWVPAKRGRPSKRETTA